MSSTYVPPTVDDFRQRFLGFSGFPDDTVQMVLDEAILEVTDAWVGRDRFNATLYLTAHLLWTQEQGVIDPTGSNGDGGEGGSISTVTGGQLKRRKVGDVEVEWSVDSTTKSSGGGSVTGSGAFITAAYYESIYGKRYLELMRKSFPAVRVI